jgi:hypothetical protein
LDKNSKTERDLEGKELLAYFPFADSFLALKFTGSKEISLMNAKLKGTGKVAAMAFVSFSPFLRLSECMNITKSFTDDAGPNRDMNKVTTEEEVFYNPRV